MDDNDPDFMLESEYSDELPVDDTLPTDNFEPKSAPVSQSVAQPEPATAIAKDHRTMLQEEEEDVNKDAGDEKSSIERKSIYEDLAEKEHSFSKAKLEASSEFAEEMRKRQEFEQERRQRFIAAEKIIKKNGGQQITHNGAPLSFAQFQELESKHIIEGGKIAKVEDETAKLLNRKIAENTAADLAEDKDVHGVKQGLITAISMEGVLAVIYVLNRVFVFPKVLSFAFDMIIIMLTILSLVVITMSLKNAEDHHVPQRHNRLFVGATILPSVIIRIGIATGLAALLRFIPTAGGYIGFALGIALGGIIHYSYVGHFRADITEITSFIATGACFLLLIIPDLTTGAANQPVDPELRLGFAVYIIEILVILLTDQMMLKLKEWRESR